MRVSKLVCTLGVVLFSFGCTSSSNKAVMPVERMSDTQIKLNSPVGLKIEEVGEKQFPISVEFNGKITVPDKDIITLSSRVAGRLENLIVSVGDRVSRGIGIGSIWSSDLATTAEEYAIAKKEGGMLLELTKKKIQALGVGLSDMVPGRTNFTLYSPADGVILEKKVNAGAAVNPGDAILTIGRLNSVQFIGDVSPEIASQIKSGMKIMFDDVANLSAIVESVSPISDPITHLVRIRGKFVGEIPKDLPQESFLKSRVVLREVPSLVLPAKALILVQGKEYVFVQSINDSHLYDRVLVNVQNRNSNEVSVRREDFGRDRVSVISEGALLANDILDEEAKD